MTVISCIVSAFSWYIKLKCGCSKIGNITLGRIRWASHISEWIILEYRRQVTGWTIQWRKTSGKTRWGELVAGEYKRMEETSRGQAYLEVKWWRGQGQMRVVAPLKEEEEKETKKKGRSRKRRRRRRKWWWWWFAGRSGGTLVSQSSRSTYLTNDIYLLVVTFRRFCSPHDWKEYHQIIRCRILEYLSILPASSSLPSSVSVFSRSFIHTILASAYDSFFASSHRSSKDLLSE